MNKKLGELFEYNHHSNQELIKIFQNKMDLVSEKSWELINHILNAHQIWNARILNQESFQTWQINDLDKLNSINNSNFQDTQKILAESHLEFVLNYTNLKGLKFQNTIEDILFHIINHSTYHRGQIAILFRQNGIEPIPTDYIFYKR